jgi:hypothetical protein
MMCLFFARRSPLLLLLDPLYIAAALCGYFGACKRQPLMIMTHIMLVVGARARSPFPSDAV